MMVQADSGPAAAPGARPLAQPPAPAPPIRRRTALALLGAILAAAVALRLWHIRHGLPFAYNADEAEHFVPKAIEMFRGGLDPGYYENPPALTYLLYAVFKVRFTAGFPFGGGRDLVRGFAADPEAAFATARVAVALIGTLVVALAYWAGARFYERRVGLVAAAIMAVAFLPVFYSKHALNDVVTLAPVTVGLVGCLLVYERGRWVDWALAGGAIGAATATKYTAGAMLLTVALAAALRVHRTRSSPSAARSTRTRSSPSAARSTGEHAELRRAVAGLAIAGAAFAAVFLLLNPYALLNLDEFRRQVEGQSRQAESDKLGQDDVRGWLYYVGTLGWGLGWVPLAAAVGGALAALRKDWRRALLLVAFPVLLYLYMGGQARFFGRWLLPAYPALCVLAGYGIVALANVVARRPRHAGAVVAGLAALACVQGLLSAIHIDTVLGRTDTREQALRWIDANVPARARLVVEPFVPDSWRAALERPVYPVERPYQAYEKRLRVRRIDRYRRQGYCWVVVGSLQKGRGLKAGLRSSRSYYHALDAASAGKVTFSPFAPEAAPVRFSYDKSFNYQPRAYERPGPVVEIHRLRDCTPAIG
jgi:Dolichyl-phosphate-mannose-protein mannosyltransferase